MIYNSVNQIYLYQGEGESRAGVDKAGVDKLVELLPQYFFGSKLKLIDGKEIQPDKWNPSGTLFVLPGGACSEWKWINTDTVKKVQEFVDKGGKIFAICAGAFCLSREVEYTLSTDTVLKKKRGFDFFSGKAIGPLLLDSMPKDTPLSLVVCAVKVQLEKTLQGSSSCGSAILAGGGYFVPDEKPLHPYEVLATYKKAPSDQSVAAVKCFVGKGTVVLSFIHWEYDYSDYPQEALTQLFPKQKDFWEKTYRKIKEGESFQKSGMAKMLQAVCAQNPTKTLKNIEGINSLSKGLKFEGKESTYI